MPPPHLCHRLPQAWNNLRASQAAAAKATKTPKEAQEGGDSEAAGACGRVCVCVCVCTACVLGGGR